MTPPKPNERTSTTPNLITLRPGARATIMRTAMIGGGLKYDAYVPIAHVHIPAERACDITTVIDYEGPRGKRREFVRLADATRPPSLQRMPLGVKRLRAAIAHEGQADRVGYALARTVFPELELLDRLPKLWAFGLIENETSQERTVPIGSASHEQHTGTGTSAAPAPKHPRTHPGGDRWNTPSASTSTPVNPGATSG